MGLFGRIVIALILSTPVLCQNCPRQGLASILQNLLTSNPQLLKMASSRQLCNKDYTYGYETPVAPVIQGQYLSNFQNQYRKQPTVIEMPYPVVQPMQSYQAPVVPVQPVTPVQPLVQQPVKEVAYQYPVSQQVQTVSQSYLGPGCPRPPIPYTSPASLVNPFLPAASPVSAMAPPTSSLLPPVNPSINKNQFLRKVAFPPPCI